MPLRKILRNAMEGSTRDYTNKELASILEVSESTISNYFRDSKYELPFHYWVKAIKYLKPELEEEIIPVIANYILEIDSKQCKRVMMEYYAINHNIEKLAELVELESKSINKENRDWAKAYSLVLTFLRKDIPMKELLDKIEEYSPSYKTPCIIKKILTVYVCYRLKYYKQFFDVAKKVENDIKEVKNFLLREFFMVRLSEVLSNAYLFVEADSRKARFYANNIINSHLICARFKYNLYYIMGVSYLFDSYDDFKYYMNIYVKYLKQYNRENALNYVLYNDFAFADTYWGKEVKDVENYDKSERAHFEARYGDKEMALMILDEIKDTNDPFQMCYRGIATSNASLLLESMIKLENDGNKFFAQLPLYELRNYGMHKETAELVFKTIKIA